MCLEIPFHIARKRCVQGQPSPKANWGSPLGQLLRRGCLPPSALLPPLFLLRQPPGWERKRLEWSELCLFLLPCLSPSPLPFPGPGSWRSGGRPSTRRPQAAFHKGARRPCTGPEQAAAGCLRLPEGLGQPAGRQEKPGWHLALHLGRRVAAT